jgi:hypothetical protein
MYINATSLWSRYVERLKYIMQELVLVSTAFEYR